MKRKITSLLLTGAITVNVAAASTVAHAAAFTDVPDTAWYAQAVDYAVSHGMFSGTGNDTFSPMTPMTRGMIVVVLGNVLKADASSATDANFSDVQPSAWYADAIDWAYENGYVSGTGANTFSPDTVVTRAQIAVILSNYLRSLNMDFKENDNITFKDAATIPAWAVKGVAYMQSVGLMSGDTAGNFNPNKELTRAEAATVFMRMDQLMSEGNGASGDNSGDQTETQTTLPGGIIVKDEPISVKEAFETIAPGVNDTQARPGKSSEGLIPAGTEMAVGNEVVEQQVYVDLGNGVIGVMTTSFDTGMKVRTTFLEVPGYPGDEFTLDAAQFGYIQPGKWKTPDKSASITNLDGYKAEVTIKSAGSCAIQFYNDERDESGNKPMLLTVGVTSYERRPDAGETANFHLDTDNEPVYYVSPSPEYYRLAQVWYTDKGTVFTSKETAHHTTNGLDVIGNIYVYPDAAANISKSDITAEGYVKPECITKYYSISTLETDTRYLAVGDYLTLGFYVMNSAAENTVVQVNITSLETGLTQSLDIAIRYAG